MQIIAGPSYFPGSCSGYGPIGGKMTESLPSRSLLVMTPSSPVLSWTLLRVPRVRWLTAFNTSQTFSLCAYPHLLLPTFCLG